MKITQHQKPRPVHKGRSGLSWALVHDWLPRFPRRRRYRHRILTAPASSVSAARPPTAGVVPSIKQGTGRGAMQRCKRRIWGRRGRGDSRQSRRVQWVAKQKKSSVDQEMGTAAGRWKSSMGSEGRMAAVSDGDGWQIVGSPGRLLRRTPRQDAHRRHAAVSLPFRRALLILRWGGSTGVTAAAHQVGVSARSPQLAARGGCRGTRRLLPTKKMPAT